MRRREFIAALGGAAAWPLAARAQQPTKPVIGFLNSQSQDTYADRLRAFHRGLKEESYIENDSVTVIYRWAENRIDRLPDLAADLVRRRVDLIAAGNTPSVIAARAATAQIPITFTVGEDPVKLGLVASLARPGGNLTGINFFNAELAAKRLELLRELVPTATRIAVLVNPINPSSETLVNDIQLAAKTIGLTIQVYNAATSSEIGAAFATFMRDRPHALIVGGDGLFTSRRVQLATLTARYSIPATFSSREITAAGGLMSYGTNIAAAFGQMGAYVGRILKGAKPSDLPVLQASKFELVLNAETARVLGLSIPPSLLAIADEVIE